MGVCGREALGEIRYSFDETRSLFGKVCTNSWKAERGYRSRVPHGKNPSPARLARSKAKELHGDPGKFTALFFLCGLHLRAIRHFFDVYAPKTYGSECVSGVIVHCAITMYTYAGLKEGRKNCTGERTRPRVSRGLTAKGS